MPAAVRDVGKKPYVSCRRWVELTRAWKLRAGAENVGSDGWGVMLEWKSLTKSFGCGYQSLLVLAFVVMTVCLLNLFRFQRKSLFHLIFFSTWKDRMKHNPGGFSNHKGARGGDVHKSQGPSAWTFALRPAHRDSSGKCLWPCWRMAWNPS